MPGNVSAAGAAVEAAGGGLRGEESGWVHRSLARLSENGFKIPVHFKTLVWILIPTSFASSSSDTFVSCSTHTHQQRNLAIKGLS